MNKRFLMVGVVVAVSLPTVVARNASGQVRYNATDLGTLPGYTSIQAFGNQFTTGR